MRRTGSARTSEQGSDRWRGVDGSTCKRFGCEEPAVVEVRDNAVRTRCEAGHVESSCFTQQDEGEVEFEQVDEEEDEPEGVTRGPSDGELDRQDGYERGRPDESEVGSTPKWTVPQKDPVPVHDMSEYGE